MRGVYPGSIETRARPLPDTCGARRSRHRDQVPRFRPSRSPGWLRPSPLLAALPAQDIALRTRDAEIRRSRESSADAHTLSTWVPDVTQCADTTHTALGRGSCAPILRNDSVKAVVFDGVHRRTVADKQYRHFVHAYLSFQMRTKIRRCADIGPSVRGRFTPITYSRSALSGL